MKTTTMKIKMTATKLGQDQTPTGAAKAQRTYLKDEEYVVGKSLGEAFVAMKAAVVVGEEGEKKVPAGDDSATESAKEGAPENKMKKGSTEKKGK